MQSSCTMDHQGSSGLSVDVNNFQLESLNLNNTFAWAACKFYQLTARCPAPTHHHVLIQVLYIYGISHQGREVELDPRSQRENVSPKTPQAASTASQADHYRQYLTVLHCFADMLKAGVDESWCGWPMGSRAKFPGWSDCPVA